MNDLGNFLTTQEALIVYMVAGLSCALCFIIYLVEKNNVKLRQKHNTKELNKLVDQVKEEAHIVEEEQTMYNVPILEAIPEEIHEDSMVTEMINSTIQEEPVLEPIAVLEPVVEDAPLIYDSVDILEESDYLEQEKKIEELEYTSIEPDPETAQKELQKLTEELKQQEEMEEVEDIPLTNYEVEQEENAIISLDELLKKSKDMYEANELTQYMDEGNEPISLEELEKKIGKTSNVVDENFVLENVVPKEENIAVTIEADEDLKPQTVAVKPVVEEVKRFKSSPIISPIYGIAKEVEPNNDIELQNTANYEKLDAEIQKTNEFLMSLKELQEKN